MVEIAATWQVNGIKNRFAKRLDRPSAAPTYRRGCWPTVQVVSYPAADRDWPSAKKKRANADFKHAHESGRESNRVIIKCIFCNIRYGNCYRCVRTSWCLHDYDHCAAKRNLNVLWKCPGGSKIIKWITFDRKTVAKKASFVSIHQSDRSDVILLLNRSIYPTAFVIVSSIAT